MKGSRPPPCSSFSMTMTDEDRGVMFGGYTPSGKTSKAWALHLPTMVSHILNIKFNISIVKLLNTESRVCLGYKQRVFGLVLLQVQQMHYLPRISNMLIVKFSYCFITW